MNRLGDRAALHADEVRATDALVGGEPAPLQRLRTVLESRLGSWGLFALILLVATLMRFALHPLLGDRYTHVTYVPAVVLVAALQGWRHGLAALALSMLVAMHFFYGFERVDREAVLALALGIVPGQLILITLAEGMRRAWARARASSARAEAAEADRRLVLAASEVCIWSWEFTSGLVHFEHHGVPAPDGPAPPNPMQIKRFFDLVEPADRATLRAALERAKLTGFYDCEYRLRQGAQVRTVMARGQLERDEHGAPVRIRGIGIDITGRRELERGLRDRELHLRLAMESAAAITFEWDIPNDVVRRLLSSEPALPPTGERAERVADVIRVVHPEDRERVRANVERALGSPDGQYVSEHRIVRENGEVRWYGERGRVEFDAARQPLRLVGISHDITELKRIEELSQINAQRLQIALSAAALGEFELDLRAHRMRISERLAAILGRTAAEVEAGPLNETSHPEDREAMAARLAERIAHREPTAQSEYRIVRPDGTIRWIESRGRIEYDASGEAKRLVGVSIDVTERKGAEAALRAAAAALAQRNTQLDLLARVSQRLILGEKQDERELLEATFAEIGEAIDMEMFYHYRPGSDPQMLELSGSGGISETERERFATMRYGELLCGRVAERRAALIVEDLQHSGQPGAEALAAAGVQSYFGFPLLARGELLGTLAFVSRRRTHLHEGELQTIRTICDQVAATIERARLLRELRTADRQKDEFLAMLAHELRNPLAPIRNASRLLAREFESRGNGSGSIAPSPISRSALTMLDRQTQQLTRLVDDLLDVSRIARGRIVLQREPLDVAQIIEQAVETTQALVREKSHQLQISRPHQRLYVDGDRARLVQTLANVLHNAAKYTEPGGHIALTVSAQEREILIEVRDDGSGIPPDLLPHVFDLFVQSERTLDRSQGGLGIGLSVVKRLVEMHGGRVGVHSEGVGRGSRFTLHLPRIDPPAIHPENAPMEHAATRRVLIVDDNPDAADSLAMLLQLEGHEVQAVYSAAAALETATRMQPDVVLLDIGLPQMDGYEVAQRMRATLQRHDTHLVALTGYGQKEDRDRARAAGFDAHLVKPADLEALSRILAQGPSAPLSA